MLIRTMSEQELTGKARTAANYGARVEIVGLWAWARFTARPLDATIEALKADGWRWSVGKRAWYMDGGHGMGRKHMSWKEIKNSFETEEVNAEETLTAKAA